MAVNALAFDLGASGGKLFSGRFDGKTISVKEIHRFKNQPVTVNGHLCWEIQQIYSNLLEGLKRSTIEKSLSLGIDSFCNDYGLLDKNGDLLTQVYMYRDHRTEGVLDFIEKKISPLELYHRTGCQRARFNTLVQLAAQTRSDDNNLLQKAEKLLFVPDLLNFYLCGEQSTEYTIASVSQLFDRRHNSWDSEIIQKFDLPQKIFPDVNPSGHRLAEVKKEILEKTGINPLSVYTVGHHDTASAVVAVPSLDKNFAYISSGTWSLVGTENDHMITTGLAFRENYANEGGVLGRNRLSKNVSGLWLIQEFQRQLQETGVKRTFEEMDLEAENTKPFKSLINPDDARFFMPGNMVEKIQHFCHETDQPLPETIGEVTRCIKESLALAYRQALEQLQEITGHEFPCVHVIGGGARSVLLNQMSASALHKPVLAGPFEATAIGNLCTQYIGLGKISGLEEARRLVRSSFTIEEYTPIEPAAWDGAYERFLSIKKKTPD